MSRSEWAVARTAGTYEAESLAAEGFIHFSRWSQLAATAGRYYADVPDLVVLVVDAAALEDLRVELSPSTGETFPHLYGCLLYTSPSPRDLSTSRMPSSA